MDARRVFVLGVNCVVFYVVVSQGVGRPGYGSNGAFEETQCADAAFAASCQSGHANAAERRLPNVIRRCYRSSDPAFSYEELPASAAPHLDTNLTKQLLL